MQAASAAYGEALESIDRELCADLPEGVHVHDIRKRTVATAFGDVSFRRKRCTDRAGDTDVPLDALIGLAPSARITPGLESELVWLAAQTSYQRAADIAAHMGPSAVSRDAVMGCMRRSGCACEADDCIRSRQKSGRENPYLSLEERRGLKRREGHQNVFCQLDVSRMVINF